MIEARIVKSGMGGFLNPPDHPEHSYSVETDLNRRPDKRGGMALSVAEHCEELSPAVRREVTIMLALWEHTRPALDSEPVKDWIKQVLGYFRGCYRGSILVNELAEPWAACNLRYSPDADPILNADIHAGVHFIRGFYPEYTPTQEDFDGAYWGTKPDA